MFRLSLAFLSVALFASTAQAQTRGGAAGARAMSGMSGGACVAGSNGLGTASFSANTANAVSTNAMGFGTNVAAANGPGSTAIASMPGGMYGTNASTAAAYGMGAYGVNAWSNPYAQVNNGYGSSFGGFGAMDSMNGGLDFAGNEFSLLSAQYAAAMADVGWAPSDTTLRTRSKATKSNAKVKHRSKRTRRTSD